MKFKCTHATNDTDYSNIEIFIEKEELNNVTKAMQSIIKHIPESAYWIAFRSEAQLVDGGIMERPNLSTLNMWRDGDMYIECDLNEISYEAFIGRWNEDYCKR